MLKFDDMNAKRAIGPRVASRYRKIKPHSSQSRLNARRTAKWYIMLSKCAKNITEVSRNKVLVCNASPKKIGDNELKSGGTGRL